MFSFRKLLGCILAPIGAFTIIGSGFSLWYFVDSDVKVEDVSGEISVETVSAVPSGRMEITQSPHLVVLSQGSDESANLFDGITFYTRSSIQIDDTSSISTANNDYLITYPDDTFTFRYYTENQDFLDSEFLSKVGLKLNYGISFVIQSSDEIADKEPFSKFITVTDSIKNSYEELNESYFNGGQLKKISSRDFFIINNHTNEARDLGFTSNLGSRVITTQEDGAQITSTEYYREISVNLNGLFRYTDIKHKPNDFKSYQALYQAMENANWKVTIELVSFYSDLTN